MTVHGRPAPATRVCSTAGKLSLTDGVTARLSPRTTTCRTVAGVDAAVGAEGLDPHAATRQVASRQANARSRSCCCTRVLHIRMREARPQERFVRLKPDTTSEHCRR